MHRRGRPGRPFAILWSPVEQCFIRRPMLVSAVAESARPRIDGFFGSLTVNGLKYGHDIIIHADGSVTDRYHGSPPEKRTRLNQVYATDYFHIPLAEWELEFLEAERPEVIIIGAGFKSMMPITPRAKQVLASYEVKIVPTPRAIELANAETRRYVAILHSTC